MKRFAVFTLVLLALVMVEAATARADLLITPLRAVFEGRDRSTVITLINTTDAPKTYRLDWKLLKMKDDGAYDQVDEFIDEDGINRSAEDMIRFSPRQVTLEPQGRQRIRLSLRRPADLKEGEYRAHLNIVRLQDDFQPNVPGEIRGAAILMQVNLGFSIPVIVRQGKSMPSVEITNPRFETDTDAKGNAVPELAVDLINNDSDYSAYGRIRVFWHPSGGEARQIGILNNIAVYPENKNRRATVRLEESNLSNGRIQVVYEGDGEYKGVVFDNKAFPIQ